MKKHNLLFAACVVVVFSATALTTPKKFTLTEENATKLFQAIEITKKGLPSSSSVSAVEASTALQSMAEIQKVLSEQYQAQSKTDSVKPKTKK